MRRRGIKFKKPGIISWLLLVITALTILAFLLGTLAANINPHTNIYISFLGLAWVYLLCLLVALAVIWLLRGWLLTSLLIALCIAITSPRLKYAYSYHPNGQDYTRVMAPNHLRLVTYNVHSFASAEDVKDTMARTQMVNVLADEKPDVVCLQEFSTNFKGRHNMVAQLKEKLAMPYVYFQPATANSYEGVGLAIFSKYNIAATKHIQFEEGRRGNECISADIHLGNRLVRIYCVHLQSNGFAKNDYDYIDSLKAGSQGDYHAGLRIGRTLQYTFLKRSKQADIMRKELEKCEMPFIIAGDFNDTPASYAVNKILNGYNNAFALKGTGFGTTYNGKFPNFQIDYIGSSIHFNVLSYRIPQYKLSDHYPVRSDLQLLPATH